MDSLQGHSVPPPRILLLEDDPAIARTVIYALERSGLQVTHCLLVRDALQQLALRPHDLLVLDVGLPDGSGLDVCRQVRAQGATPVLMLSAHGEEIDRVLGLELGADDYVTKPFSPRELVARVRGLLRRAAPTAATPATPPGLFTVDAAAQRASLRSQPLDLTRREFGLLAELLRRPGHIRSREALLNAVWGPDSDSTERTVDTHIKMLRGHLGQYRSCIVTVWGMGYKFEADES